MQRIPLYMKIIFSTLPLLIGGFLYLGYRAETLLMFKWIDFLGLRQIINQFRLFSIEYPLPTWIYYSLPDGLWLFSYMLLINSIWNKGNKVQYLFWLYILPVIALTSEVLQIFFPKLGTFDLIDIIFYLLAILTFKILKKWKGNKTSCH